mgnify:CR=1 FL=1
MPYSLTRNFPFGKIKQNHSKLNKTERNGKGDRQKSPAKDNAEVHPFIKGGLFAPYRVKYNLTYNAK